MFKKYKNITLALGVVVGLTACGGGGSDSNTKTDSNKTIGHFIDSPVKGINYECGDIKGITDSNGTFSCEKTPVTFKLGEMKIGSLNAFTKDNKMYPQDLLGLSRDNFTDKKLIKLIRLIQSLDDDEDISKNINIESDVSEVFTSSLDFDKSILEVLSAPANGDLVSQEDAIKHLQNSMGADAHLGNREESGDDIENTSNDILEDVVNNFSDNNESNSSSPLDGVDLDALSGDNNLTKESISGNDDDSSSNPLGDIDALTTGTDDESSSSSENPLADSDIENGNKEDSKNSAGDINVTSLIDENSGDDKNQAGDVDVDSLVDENSGDDKNQAGDVDVDSLIDENSGKDNSSIDKKKTGTGYYVDSAIEGVQYECGDQNGLTDSNGTFTFEEGKRCVFKLEGVLLRQVDAVDLENKMILLEDNINNARLLQSLDNDGDADNGIEISQEILDGLSASDLTAVPIGDAEIKDFFKELGVTDIAGFDGAIKTLDETNEHLKKSKEEIKRLQEIIDDNSVSEEETENMTDELENDLDNDLDFV